MARSDTSLAGQDLRDRDLRHQDLTGKSLFGADLSGSQLYGAQISLLCSTFDGVKLDNNQIALLLLMISQADIDPRWRPNLRLLVASIIGKDQLKVFDRYLAVIE
jgi:uncharacterized protein YjbI with pentapeptide repeats